MKLTIRPAARGDILQQYERYLGLDLPPIAERFLAAIRDAAESIMHNPEAGSPRQLANPLLEGLRSWRVAGFENVRIYYIARANEAELIRVLHGRRDIRGLLESERDHETR